MCEAMLEGKGKLINRPTKTRTKAYDKFFIYLPTDVATDSGFPFKPGDIVKVKVDGTRLVIEKANEP